MTQWFRRGQDGIGNGESGLRLPHEWRGREVAVRCFPELLVREKWNSRLEESVISDYHRWMAPLLLLWPRLSRETRRRLEIQACEKPRWLARIQRLLPALDGSGAHTGGPGGGPHGRSPVRCRPALDELVYVFV
jgi:hypothetical protein